ncbi:YmfL family putative regulatory protein [Paludibacterium paludis]|uniref:DNA-binding protein n=1 Tax=Paludibacterium paludis TaxID=1225769 RepID=A0A918U711_9NEIS|nr:YmfL family putative regulatory protein [Paludibacterium paludis]GGY03666.1 hypothetical protein GCM10011289_02500 [Paludibacterium paludis]
MEIEQRIIGSLRMMARAMNGGWKGMAEALDTTVLKLQNRVYCRKGQEPTVSLALRMQQASETTYFAEAVAVASGGIFVRMPAVEDLGNEEIQEKFLELLETVGEHVRAYREVTADDEINDQERRRLEGIAHSICQLVTNINWLTFRIYCKQV